MGAEKPESSIYSEAGIAAMARIGAQATGAQAEYPDRNIFIWYQRRLPAQLPDAHLIDWGAGTGRFAPLYLSRQPRRLTLVEPSAAGYGRLCEHFGQSPHVELFHASLGAEVTRWAPPSEVLHFCTFVINCLPNPREAFRLLAQSILPGERLIAFTNVFVPPSLAEQLRWDEVFEEQVFVLHALDPVEERPPRSTTFTNQILGSETVLLDSVHTIYEYQELLGSSPDWRIERTSLLPPWGFRHVFRPDDDFGNLIFAVMNLELIRI